MGLDKGVNCGFVTTSPSGDPDETPHGVRLVAQGLKDTAPSGYNAVTEIGWWFDGNISGDEDTHYGVGIYSHDAANNKPGNAVGELYNYIPRGMSFEVWIRKSGINIPITSGITYWIALTVGFTTASEYTDAKTVIGQRIWIKGGPDFLITPWWEDGVAQEKLIAVYAKVEKVLVPEVPVPGDTHIVCSSTDPDILDIIVDGSIIGRGTSN